MFKSNRGYKLYVEDIANECKNIKKFAENITYDEFTENLEKVYAVAKYFENIGEAVKNIPKENPNADSILKNWWTLKSRKISNYDGKVYSGDVTKVWKD